MDFGSGPDPEEMTPLPPTTMRAASVNLAAACSRCSRKHQRHRHSSIWSTVFFRHCHPHSESRDSREQRLGDSSEQSSREGSGVDSALAELIKPVLARKYDDDIIIYILFVLKDAFP